MKLRQKNPLWSYCVGVGALFVFGGPAQAIDVYVDQVFGNDNNSGIGSWSNAKETLSAGIAAAGASPTGGVIDTIRVAEGTYRVPSQSGAFEVRRYLRVLGGYPSGGDDDENRDPATYPTILSGDVNGNDDQQTFSDNAYHVITMSMPSPVQGLNLPPTTVDGFIITGGRATSSGNNSIGGGALVYPANGTSLVPVFINCRFEGNIADGAGGAVAQSTGTAVEFRHCVFIDNSTGGAGLTGTHHVGGGAISSGGVRMANCQFEGNASGSSGGAIAALSIDAVNADFRMNEADESGGAIYIDNNVVGRYQIVNCLFAGNVASGADEAGGAIFIDDNDEPVIIHCTIVHNDAPNGDAGGMHVGEANIWNTILWGNTDSGSSGHGAQLVGDTRPAHCIIEDFTAFTGCTGSTVIDADPAFMDVDGADDNITTVLDNVYRIGTSSPGKDSGDNVLIPSDDLDADDNTNTGEELPVDLDIVKPRVLFDVVDRGTYEFTCLGDCVRHE